MNEKIKEQLELNCKKKIKTFYSKINQSLPTTRYKQESSAIVLEISDEIPDDNVKSNRGLPQIMFLQKETVLAAIGLLPIIALSTIHAAWYELFIATV